MSNHPDSRDSSDRRQTPTGESRLALVTGASDGIGLAIAERLARDGLDLILVARNPDKLARAAGQLSATHGVTTVTVPADLAAPGAPREIAAAVRRTTEWHGGRLDVLVNNAGFGRFTPFAEVDTAEFEQQFDLNLRAPFFLTQALLPELAAAKGVVVNLSSYFADKMVPGRPSTAYSATKGALNSWTRALAFELGADGIRVNAVAPGSVETPIFRANLARLSDEGRSRFESFVKNHYPLGGRIGVPAEIADAVAFLAGPQSRWMTGAILHVDGGLTVS